MLSKAVLVPCPGLNPDCAGLECCLKLDELVVGLLLISLSLLGNGSFATGQ